MKKTEKYFKERLGKKDLKMQKTEQDIKQDLKTKI